MNELSFIEYALKAKETAIYPEAGKDMIYPCLGLKGEIGEVCEHLKKAIRDDGGNLSEERTGKLHKELGDVAWYLAAVLRTIPITESISVELLHPAGYNQTPNQGAMLSATIRQIDKLAYYATQCSQDIKQDLAGFGSLVTTCFKHWRNACLSLGFDPAEVLEANLDKLFDRKDRGVLQGSGDDR